jgi:hypothetical protein
MTENSPVPVTRKSLPGIKTMLVGGSGTGKTHCIRTLVDAGLEVFVLFTEPGMEVLADISSDKLHWHYIPASSASWADMLDSATKINSMSLKMLSDLGDINKRNYTEFKDVLVCLSNFQDDRTGQFFGAVDSWDSNRVLVIDSLSGLSVMAMNMVTGSKPVKSISDWGIAVDNLERLTTKCCVDLKCHFVLIAHLEREKDEVTGGESLMASTLGRKLGPKLPRNFSEVIHVRRDGAVFSWSTASFNVDLKTRYLPLKENIPPSFQPLIEKWRSLDK